MKSRYLTAATPILLTLSLVPALGHAQTAPEDADAVMQPILVTALKREQSVQDVAASVTALSADMLAESGVTNSFDLQQLVPGLAISFGNRETNVAIRGVSNNVRSIGSDPSNAVHLDGVYLPQSSMILTDLFDIQRVEVLKGPQGTLYGRNATGGAINVISRAPEAGLSAEGLLGVGSFNLRRAQLAVNAGSEAVAGRLAVSYVEDDGYTENVLTGEGLDAQDFTALRGQVRFQLSENADLTFLAQTASDDGTVGYGISTDPSFRAFPANFYGAFVPANLQRIDERNIRLDSPVSSRRDSDIYAATLNWDFGGFALRAITGYSNYDAADALDYDFTGDFNETFVSTTEVESVSQEFQLYSTTPGPLEWTLGAYLYQDEGAQFVDWFAFGPFARANTTSEGEARALFGQATYHFNDQWALMAGGRYNEEEKTGQTRNFIAGTTADVTASFDSFTPQVQIQYRPTDDIMTYFGVSQGFKSGGFNLLAAGPPTLYQPEEIVAYEAGLRTSSADGRATFNASIFNYDYSDLQLRTLLFTGSGGGAFASVNNAEGASVTGFEVNTEVDLSDSLRFDLATTYLDATFDNYISPSNNRDLSGTRLPLSPEWSGTMGLAYETPLAGGDLRARLEYVSRSRIIFPLTIDETQNFDEASSLVNATARWTAPGGNYYVEIVGRNLTDELYRVQRADIFFSGVYDSFGAPRTGEVRVGFNF